MHNASTLELLQEHLADLKQAWSRLNSEHPTS